MNKFIEKFGRYPHQALFNNDNILSIREYTNSIVLDLFDTLISIVYHDLFTQRTEGAKPVEVEIPVQNFKLFQEINIEFNKLVSFMTGTEDWIISFKSSDIEKIIINDNQEQFDLIEFNSIALISAGLDSMAGVSKEIQDGNKTLFINSYTHNESSLIGRIYDEFKDLYNFEIVYIHKYPRVGDGEGTLHSNQRTRSLAFLANALIYSDYFNIREVKMYENGIMSLNPSFDLRRGVTKTTHHKTLFMLNAILDKLDIQTRIVNPFKYKTKKDIVLSINDNFIHKIKLTRTCSKGNVIPLKRDNKNGGYHCGCCIACILRLIATHNLPISDAIYKVQKYDLARDTSKEADRKFSYHEKKSLIEYYKRFKKEIDEGTIFDYLDGIHMKYFDNDPDFLEKITEMLGKFSLEISAYVSKISYD